MASEDLPIVLDNGSGTCKIGFAKEDSPRASFSSVVGRIKNPRRQQQSVFVGEEALQRKFRLVLQHPIEHGVVQHWDDMEKIWRQAFAEVCPKPEDYPVLITEPPLNPKTNREKMAEIMFETFNVKALYVALPAALSLHSRGHTTGLVLESGDGVSQVVPIYEGYAVTKGIRRADLAGRDLTDYLKKILTGRGYSLNSTAERELVREIKEQFCYVAENYEQELKNAFENSNFSKSYQLPDGNIINIGDEMFRCPEALFKPSALGMDMDGLDVIINNSLMDCDLDIRTKLFKNVVLSGGNTMFPGFQTRLQKELTSLALSSMEVVVDAAPNRQNSVWIGGSILGGSSTMANKWVTKNDYEESGAQVLFVKCY